MDFNKLKETIKNRIKKDNTTQFATATVGGAIAGAGVSSIIGGIGVALCGTAVGITIAPLTAIGAGVGLISYGLISLGKKIQKNSEENNESKIS